MKSKASTIQIKHKSLFSPVAENLERGGIRQQQRKVRASDGPGTPSTSLLLLP